MPSTLPRHPRITTALLTAFVLLAAGCAPTGPAPTTTTTSTTSTASTTTSTTTTTTSTTTTTTTTAPPVDPSGVLVLYDTTSIWGWLGESYATMTTNLVSRFDTPTAKPVVDYEAGDIELYEATIYVGSTYDEPLPTEFLDDVLATTRPIVWMQGNIWQLTAHESGFYDRFGWIWDHYDTSPVDGVTYDGRTVDRFAANPSGIMDYAGIDPARAEILATAVREDDTTFPWAVRSANLTYLGEIPYSYIRENDRYLVWADLLFDVLAPGTPERHRAMVRLEDVGPDSDPDELRDIADFLFDEGIPFSVATYSLYSDPLGLYNGGVPEFIALKDAPDVVSALEYMAARGGTILQHGRTHQYESAINPYSGVSGEDFEFYLAHVDPDDSVILDGPVPADSYEWATDRIEAGRDDFTAAGLSPPEIFEFPHYAASVEDYRAVDDLLGWGYDRRLYFPGVLSGSEPDYSRVFGQFFPYPVTDAYSTEVLPENIGNFEPFPFNNHPAVLVPELVERAEANLVVRDGFASFFYHPFFGLGPLQDLVAGINDIGVYTWVSPADLGAPTPPAAASTEGPAARGTVTSGGAASSPTATQTPRPRPTPVPDSPQVPAPPPQPAPPASG